MDPWRLTIVAPRRIEDRRCRMERLGKVYHPENIKVEAIAKRIEQKSKKHK
jgi:hypothetical protein